MEYEQEDNPLVALTKPDGKEMDPREGGIVAQYVESCFSDAKSARQKDEERWKIAYKNYRGEYDTETQFTDTEVSQVFVKVTKTKVLAAYGQICDVLFGGNKFPISVKPLDLGDEGIATHVHFNPEDVPSNNKEPGGYLKNRLGPTKKTLEKLEGKLEEGAGALPTDVTFSPAQEAASIMERQIHNQLEETSAKKHLRSAVFECSLFGTGIIKGPFVETKETPRWTDGTYDPIERDIPKISSVSIWDFYPDPDARFIEEANYVVQRHKMSIAQLNGLKRKPHFTTEAIKTAIAYGPSYTREDFEHLMEDSEQTKSNDRFEVLEYWGYITRDQIENDMTLDVPKDVPSDVDEFSMNVWVCNGMVLRFVLNPYQPTALPYYVVPYEQNPYNIFGVGVAENMEDSQILMNGFMRMAVDNAALSGNLVFEVDETYLTPGQDLKMYPGKVVSRQAGAPGQAIFSHKFQNVSSENMMMFDKARQLSDESTGFPSFAHGQTGVSGVGRTASGISMLMSAANGQIKTVVKNYDDYLLGPLGQSFFNYNLRYDPKEEYKEGIEVKASGTESLMANEVRSQRLMQFLGTMQNPVLAPFAKLPYIVEQIAKSMDLDPDLVVNSMEEAAAQAEVLKLMSPQPETPAEAPLSAEDTSGGGGSNIGVGSTPNPGEQGFTGNDQGGPIQ